MVTTILLLWTVCASLDAELSMTMYCMGFWHSGNLAVPLHQIAACSKWLTSTWWKQGTAGIRLSLYVVDYNYNRPCTKVTEWQVKYEGSHRCLCFPHGEQAVCCWPNKRSLYHQTERKLVSRFPHFVENYRAKEGTFRFKVTDSSFAKREGRRRLLGWTGLITPPDRELHRQSSPSHYHAWTPSYTVHVFPSLHEVCRFPRMTILSICFTCGTESDSQFGKRWNHEQLVSSLYETCFLAHSKLKFSRAHNLTLLHTMSKRSFKSSTS